jgi:hypothetical protein
VEQRPACAARAIGLAYAACDHSLVTIATGDSVDTEPPPGRRREEFLIIAFIVVALVTMATLIWSHSAKVFDRGGAIQSMTVPGNAPRFISVDAFSGGANAPLHSLHLNSAKPIVVENTANATVQVLLCRPINDFGGAWLAADMLRFCSSMESFRPVSGSFYPKPGSWWLVAEITPHQPGVVHLAQVNVTFREGLRTGKQRVGNDFTLTVT